jgi:hypothetical protein
MNPLAARRQRLRTIPSESKAVKQSQIASAHKKRGDRSLQ